MNAFDLLRIRPAAPSISYLAAFMMLITLTWGGVAVCGEIHDAARRDDLEKVKALLAKGADVNAKRATDGATALLLASQEGHLDVVQALLDKNVDVNAKKTNDGSTLW